MEEIITRFPHLGEQIFDQLKGKDLQKCREVEESWKIFIDSQKSQWIRVIKKHLRQPDKDWKEVAKISNVETVRNLASAVYDHYVRYGIRYDDSKNDQETDSLDDEDDVDEEDDRDAGTGQTGQAAVWPGFPNPFLSEDQGNSLKGIDKCSSEAQYVVLL